MTVSRKALGQQSTWYCNDCVPGDGPSYRPAVPAGREHCPLCCGYRPAEPPELVAVAGDWHGDRPWATAVVADVAERGIRLILHAGDFGVWPGPGGRSYLDKLNRACEDADVDVWFVDGNHEDFPQLLAKKRDGAGRGIVRSRIRHLPRGHRWTWHGRTWLALGGAVSIDREDRLVGRSWWPEETITAAEAQEAAAAGPADVMLTHDCPSGVTLALDPPPRRYLRAVADAEAHARLLQTVVDQVQPRHLIHGHHHRAYQRLVDFGYGPVEVTGLDRDGAVFGNWAMLSPATMEWTIPH